MPAPVMPNGRWTTGANPFLAAKRYRSDVPVDFESLRRHWHLGGLALWSAAWFVILAPHGGIDWKFFTEGTTLLFGGHPQAIQPPGGGGPGGLRVYADYPQLQMGPLSYLVTAVLRCLGPHRGVVAAEVLLAACGLVMVALAERIMHTARPGLPPRTARAAVLGGGAVFLVAWMELAAAFAHLDDGLALLLALLAVRSAQRGYPLLAGACLGLAADAKPWGLVFLPVLLLVPPSSWWRAACGAAVMLAAAWLPFFLADSGTMAAARYRITNLPDSGLRALGVTSRSTPPWDRSAQVLAGCLLGAAAILRRRWPAVLLLAGGARIALDPAAHSYYTPDLVAGALLWDLLGWRVPVPVLTAVTFAALNVTPLLTADLAVQGSVRLAVVVLCAAVSLFAPRGWCWRADPAWEGVSS